MRTIPASPYCLTRPAIALAPVILTSPHSGRHYEPRFLAASRLDATAIRRSEDCFVDELFAAGPGLGMPLLAANFPRAWCDVNREAWELDPAMFEDALPDYVNVNSPRVGAGLGTIARIVGTGEAIYDGRLRFVDAQARVATCWEPYHRALHGLIQETRGNFGACLVIDCHSMPTIIDPQRTDQQRTDQQRVGRQRMDRQRIGRQRPDIVLGDRFETSCEPAVTAFMQRKLTEMGLQVRRNDPYAGGYITRHYGRPREGVHVVQIEVARGLYMNERAFSKTGDFAGLQTQLATLLADIAAAAMSLIAPRDLSVAAE